MLVISNQGDSIKIKKGDDLSILPRGTYLIL